MDKNVYINAEQTENQGRSQTETTLRELRSRLVAGQFPASTKLREVPLARSFGVSRTPLRSALLRLEQEGLLERSGSGYVVRAFSIDDALVAIELRGVVEGMAARLAAQRNGVEHHLAAIKVTLASLDGIVSKNLIDGYSALNDQFHRQLAGLAGNDMIVREIERASRLPFAAPSAFSSGSHDLERFKTSVLIGQQQHHALVESIERGEGARAEALAREHAHLAKTNIEVAYRERDENDREMPSLALIT